MKNSVSLYYKEGSSDKEYHIQLVEKGGGYVVNFQYGRRGNALQSGTKTPSPVDLEDAQKIYDKLENEKRAKGYDGESTGSSAKVSTTAEVRDARKTGILPQLLNPIAEEEIEQYINDNDYIAQEKHDGKRRPAEKTESEVYGVNKKGLSVVLSDDIAASLKVVGIYDGEDMGDSLLVFDLLALEGTCLKHLSVMERLEKLETVKFGKHVSVVETAYTTKEKRALYESVKKKNGEGIVFKLKTAKYVAGRPNDRGAHVKFKFYKTASFIVANNTKGKSSVGLVLLDGNKEVPVGKCTVPAKVRVPVGAVIEVRYLYAYKGGAVFQPTFLGFRDDVDREDCLLSQLIYKREEDDEE